MTVDLCISEKKWGPINAALYLTDRNTIIVKGVFFDEERNKEYPGPNYEVAQLAPELIDIKNDQPQRYLRTAKWRRFIRELWKIVEDNPWFRYPA